MALSSPRRLSDALQQKVRKMEKLPVILIDNPDQLSMQGEADFYRKLGHPVEVCVGPEKEGGCPLLRGEPCTLVEDADGVIFQLDLDVPQNRRLLSKYVTYFGRIGVPIRVVVKEEQKERWAKLLGLVQVWTSPVTVGKLDGFSSEVEYGWEQAPRPRPKSGASLVAAFPTSAPGYSFRSPQNYSTEPLDPAFPPKTISTSEKSGRGK